MAKLFLLMIGMLLLNACTSFQMNGPELRKACLKGVSKYDDGTVSFECMPRSKEDKKND